MEPGASLEGASETIAWLRGIGNRAADAGPQMAAEFEILAAEEAKVFSDLDGRYVDTGRTMESLTELAGADAIREITPWGIVFGTSVPYAEYLTKDEEGGQHTGGSAVLVNMEEEAIAGAGERILRRIVG
jgi:hypothetical protein